ncbi:hypothetical protein M3Y99_01960400 [Aphelenchoides fujianensis]|nr:hypothetical protein M3Y99_01960400 [Aphelenchoides fujianensis]
MVERQRLRTVPEHLRNDALWLHLFEDEIKATMAKAPEEAIEQCRELLPRDLVGQLDMLRDMDGENGLWTQLFWTPNVQNLLPTFKSFLKDVNPVLHKQFVRIDELPPHRKDRFFRCVFVMFDSIDVRAAVAYFSKYSKRNKQDLVDVQMLLEDKTVPEHNVRRKLLQLLPFLGDNAVDHLLFTIYKKEPEKVEKFCPNFKNVYGHIRLDEKKPQMAYGDSSRVEDVFRAFEEAEAEWDPRNASTLVFHEDKPLNTDFIKEKPLNLRKYQEELAGRGRAGGDVLICAPTNSGKTRVSIEIAREHFRRCAQRKTPFKIVGLAGTAGGAKSSLAMFKQDPHWILVMTPQIFLNSLREGDRERNVGFEDVSLLIIDEAHYVADNHPCNEIMKIYHERKDTGVLAPIQIVGMTATVGTGGAKNVSEAVNHLSHICANLDTRNVEQVLVNRAELSQHVASINDQIIACPTEYEASSKFVHFLVQLKEHLERELDKQLVGREEEFANMKKALKEPLPKGPFLRDANSGLIALCCQFKIRPGFSNEQRTAIIQVFDQLQIINKCFKYIRQLDGPTAMQTLEQEMLGLIGNRREGNQFTIGVLQEAKKWTNFNSPMLQKLIELLTSQFAAKPDSRCLIFLETREICKRLADCLNRNGISQAAFLTGSNSSEQYGLTESQQSSVLKDFNDGRLKVLAATSVADEGLDIRACNLVVKYNCASSEVAHVQRRGRARHEDSKSILLCDSRIQEQEQTNRQKERFMSEALAEVHKNHRDFWEAIGAQQQKNREERQAARIKREQVDQRRLNGDLRYAVLCNSCSAFLSTSNFLFKANNTNHVCADPEIWKRLQHLFFADGPQLIESEAPVVGKLFCKGQAKAGTCNKELGGVVSYKAGNNVLLPVMKLKQLIFVKVDRNFDAKNPQISPLAERVRLKKWADCEEKLLFSVGPIGTLELSAMQRVHDRSTFREVAREYPSIFGRAG